MLVIYEPNYSGGAGPAHGGVDDLLRFSKDDLIDKKGHNSTKEETLPRRGRYLVILSDHVSSNTASVDSLTSAVYILDSSPRLVNVRGLASEMTSVCEPLYHIAGELVKAIEPILSGSSQEHDTTKASDSSESSGDMQST